MAQQVQKAKIVRVDSGNYLKLAALLEQRRTGQTSSDLSRYTSSETRAFMDHHQLLSNDWFYIFAAQIEDEFVGYVNACLIPKPDDRKGVLFVDDIWTHPTYRNQGMGTQLMNTLIQLAKELDLWRVRLYVDTENKGGRHLYQKVGFIETTGNVFCELNLKKVAGYRINILE